MKLHVTNETAALETVVLGIGTDIGEPIGMNPMMRRHIKNGTYPTEDTIKREISTFETVLEANQVEVLRPENIEGLDQIFTRDIGFVIDDSFLIANMEKATRKLEIKGIQHILSEIEQDKIIRIPDEITIEGGDILVHNDYIFVGLGARTNRASLDFLKTKFPHKTVFGFDLRVDEDNADTNILHLDCTFQPIGLDEAIMYEEGFLKRPDVLFDLFPSEKRIRVNQEQKNRMFPNIFSISPTKIVLERNFKELKAELERRGYQTFDVDYKETSKTSGLLRCSTLPLRRKSE